MYEEFYGLNQLPFQLLPDPNFFYRSRKHEKALTYLEYGVFERAGFMVITGEIGTGKTTLLRYLLRSISEDTPIALINQTFLPPEDFLRMLCQEFSLPYKGKGKSELIELFGTFLIEQFKAGRYVILILDEAQNLPLDTLEEIRMLSNLDADNERLLQIILVGQPPLRKKLHREELRQLLQRVEVSYHLESLDREELKNYIHYRLKTAGAPDPDIFENAAIDAMYDCTGGVPRLINSMCHRCLVYGFADGQKKITADLFEKMLEDRKAEGLHPQDSIIPSTHRVPAGNGQSEIKDNPEDSISAAHLAATINRLTEISGASIKAIEMAAAKAANTNGKAELASLKRQHADEKRLREALENRLNQTTDDLAHLEKAMSHKNDTDKDQNSAFARHGLVSPAPTDSPEKDRRWIALNPTQYILLILVFIVAITLFAALVFWRPHGNVIDESPPDLKSGILEQKEAQANVPSQELKRIWPKPKIPVPTNGDTATREPEVNTSEPAKPSSAGIKTDIRNSATGSAPPATRDSQVKIDREPEETATLPAATAPQKTPETKPQPPGQTKFEKYVCIVTAANVRANPNINARILGRITQGTEVDVIGREGNWMQVNFPGTESAWIYRTLLRRQN